MDITDVLHKIRPDSSWKVGDTYESLVWLDEEQKKPTLEEIEAAWDAVELDFKTKEVRKHRNKLIAETDWMALSDVEMPKSWAEYRQALRDVPGQLEFPYNIDWPEKPE